MSPAYSAAPTGVSPSGVPGRNGGVPLGNSAFENAPGVTAHQKSRFSDHTPVKIDKSSSSPERSGGLLSSACQNSRFDSDAAMLVSPCSVSVLIAIVDSATVAILAGNAHDSNRDAPPIGAISKQSLVERHTGYVSLPIAAALPPA